MRPNKIRLKNPWGPPTPNAALEVNAERVLSDMEEMHRALDKRVPYEEHARQGKLRYRAGRLGFSLKVIRRRYWLRHRDTGVFVLKDADLEAADRLIGKCWVDWRSGV